MVIDSYQATSMTCSSDCCTLTPWRAILLFVSACTMRGFWQILLAVRIILLSLHNIWNLRISSNIRRLFVVLLLTLVLPILELWISWRERRSSHILFAFLALLTLLSTFPWVLLKDRFPADFINHF